MQDNQRQTHWAYIAGVMDSDGTFMITRHKRQTLRKNHPHTVKQWGWTYLPAVKISQIEPEAIKFISEFTGQKTIYLHGASPSRPTRRPIYSWGIRKRIDLIPFLEEVIPYLRIKKNRAEFLLKYCNHVIEIPQACRYFGLTDEELNFREDSYQKMRELNENKVAAETKPLKRESVSDSPSL